VDFVTIVENKPIFHWQIELLIESFKKFNLEDNLYVYFIGTNDSNIIFNKHIKNHKNCVFLENKSIKYGYHHFSFYEALTNYKEKVPDNDFCLIDADCILTNNDFSFFNDKNIYYQSEIVKNSDLENVITNLIKNKIQQICSLFYFSKKIPNIFFKNSLIYAEKFLVEFLKEYHDDLLQKNFNLFKYGLLINSLMENQQVTTSFDTVGFPQVNTNNFIFLSYKFDILPFFKKSNFSFEKNELIVFNPNDPFENLCMLPDFPNCIPLRNVAASYREKK